MLSHCQNATAMQNARGMVTFIIAEALAVAVLLPAVPLIIAAGLVFGFAKGLLCVWLAASIGQVAAFLLSRYEMHHDI